MKNLFIVAILIAASVMAWQKITSGRPIEALYDESYIVVYGRDNCGWTQKMMRELDARGIEYIFESVNDRQVCDELHPRMEEAGISTRRYNLPVIDVNARMFVRPELDDVLEVYEKGI